MTTRCVLQYALQILRYGKGRLAFPAGCSTLVAQLNCGSRAVAITMACEHRGSTWLASCIQKPGTTCDVGCHQLNAIL